MVRILHGPWAQYQCVKCRENSGVYPNTERERNYSRGGKTRVFLQHAKTEANVLHERVEEVGAGGVAAFFLGAFDAAEFDTRAAQRFVARLAAADQIVSVGVDVEAKLGVHLALHTRTPKNSVQPASEVAPEVHETLLM